MKKAALAVVLGLLPIFAGAQKIQSQWAGARVAFLGDSITDAGQLRSQDIYWHQLVDILGIEPYVYGISGHQTKHIKGQAEKLEAEHGQEVDAILIFIGTNDFNGSVPLGEWFKEESVIVNRRGVATILKHRTPAMDGGDMRSEVNIFMSYLKATYPTKQIILLTPIHRGYFNCSANNIQPDENYANPLGLYIDDYAQVIKEAAGVWAVPVIDLNSISGLFPLEPAQKQYFREEDMNCELTAAEASAAEPGTKNGLEHHDLLHPNTEGQLRMAYAIAYQLLGYPSKF